MHSSCRSSSEADVELLGGQGQQRRWLWAGRAFGEGVPLCGVLTIRSGFLIISSCARIWYSEPAFKEHKNGKYG